MELLRLASQEGSSEHIALQLEALESRVLLSASAGVIGAPAGIGCLSTVSPCDIRPADANNAPTLTFVAPLSGAVEDADFTITYATLAAAADEGDVDGDTLSFRVESVTSGTLQKGGQPVVPGTTLLSPGESLVWHPALNANGLLDAFTVRAWDGQLASASAVQVRVVVTEVNDPPVLTSISILAGAVEDQDFTISFDALFAASDASDPDGDTLSFRVLSISSGTLTEDGEPVEPGSFFGQGQSLVWHPAANANGTLDAFTVVAWDDRVSSSPAVQVRVAVQAVNDPPTLTSVQTLTGAVEDQDFTISYAGLLAASNMADVDVGETLSFRVESVTSGTLTKNGAPVVPGTTLLSPGESLTWHPAPNANGTLNAFTVTAWDGELGSTPPVQVRVQVQPVNDAPTLTAVQTLAGGVEDQDFTISYADLAAASDMADVDVGETLSFRVESVTSGTLTKNGTVVVPGSTLLSPGESLVWRPALNANGTLAAFTVTAWDGELGSTPQVQVKVQVQPVNDAPKATPKGVRVEVNTATDITLVGSDVETPAGDLVFALVAGPSHGQVALVGNIATYTPTGGYVGADSFTFTVTDNGDPAGSHANPGNLTSASATVSISVAPPYRSLGVIPGPGSAKVYVYDCDDTNDISLSDIAVKFGTGGSVSSVQLGGVQSMEGLGLVISGATSVGSVKDGRKGALGHVAFIASDAPIKSIQLKSTLIGYNLNGLSLGDMAFGADADGDGSQADATAIYTTGGVGSIKLTGALEGDTWIGGTDSKGLALKSLSASGGSHGDLVAAGNVGKISLGGSFDAGMRIEGLLTSLQIKGGDLAGTIQAGTAVGKVTVSGMTDKRTGRSVGGNLTAGARIRAGNTIAGLSLSGSIVGGAAEDDMVQVCARSIGSLAVKGNVANSRILAGADLGDDWCLGGAGADADSFAQGYLTKVSVGGNVADSLIGAGLNASPGGDLDLAWLATHKAFFAGSSIASLQIAGTLTSSASSGAPFGVGSYAIGSVKVGAAADHPLVFRQV